VEAVAAERLRLILAGEELLEGEQGDVGLSRAVAQASTLHSTSWTASTSTR
jgi:hypothetical protein